MRWPTAELITIGSEVLSGCVLNTNAQFLGRELTSIGFEVRHQSSCPDSIGDICRQLEKALYRSDLVIVSGGLGPTPDDVTRQAVARFFKVPLIFSQTQFRQIRKHYKRYAVKVPALVRCEAEFPQNARPLLNRHGIAMGFYILSGSRCLVVLPGVPFELIRMFEQAVRPVLKREFRKLSAKPVLVIRTVGISEPDVMNRLKRDFFEDPFEFGIYPGAGEIIIRLKADDRKILRRLSKKVEKRLEPYVYSYRDETLSTAVGRILAGKRMTLAVAESCTGGRFAAEIAEVPGASRYFKGGVVSYEDAVKNQVLKVRKATLDRYGAVSRQTALEMAQGARDLMKATFGIGITGIAGPSGGSKTKPVGTVFIALSRLKKQRVWRHEFWGGRLEVQEKAVKKALQYLWMEIR